MRKEAASDGGFIASLKITDGARDSRRQLEDLSPLTTANKRPSAQKFAQLE